MRGSEIQIKRWKRLEYEQLIEQGVFMPGERVELIDGLLLVAEPQSSSLILEVALSSLVFDREHKSSLYARAGRPEYWIVNLADRVLEIRRYPAPSPSAPYGWDYSLLAVLGPRDHARPLAAPASLIAVVDLLP